MSKETGGRLNSDCEETDVCIQAGIVTVSLTAMDNLGKRGSYSLNLYFCGGPLFKDFDLTHGDHDVREKLIEPPGLPEPPSAGGTLKFGADHISAMYFTGIPIPTKAHIVRARLKVFPDTNKSEPIPIRYCAECDGDNEEFSMTTDGELSSRLSFSEHRLACRSHVPPPYEANVHNEVDVTGIVQGIVCEDRWGTGNDPRETITLFVSDARFCEITEEDCTIDDDCAPNKCLSPNAGTRSVKSYNTNPDRAPLLYIEYVDQGGTGNCDATACP